MSYTHAPLGRNASDVELCWSLTLYMYSLGSPEKTRLVRDIIARALPQYRSGYL